MEASIGDEMSSGMRSLTKMLQKLGEKRKAHLMTAANDNGSLMDVKDLARRLQLSERTIWKLVAQKALPQPLRLGRSRRWEPEIIEKHLRAKRAEATR